MLSLRRSAVTSSRTVLRPSTRRPASSNGGHHSHEPQPHVEPPASEGFSPGFYIAVAAIPLGFAVYKFSYSNPSSQPFVERTIEKYSDFQDKWEKANALHTKMIEQAAHDRNLFQSEPVDSLPELKFPEIFNQGSPYNIMPGHGGADLTELMAYYEKKNKEIFEKQRQRATERQRQEAGKSA